MQHRPGMVPDAGERKETGGGVLESMRREIVWLLAAILAGAAALYFNYVEDFGEELNRRAMAISVWIPAIAVGAGMIVISRLRDIFFPGTSGTGIPQAMAALRMGEVPERGRVLSARIAVGKTLLLTLGLLSGATIGREGPSVHVAACCMYLTTRWARFPRHLVERGLILAGGAAGIGAAFNAPLAAIVFAFEEIGRSFQKENVAMIVRTVIVACVLSWIPLSDYTFYGRVEVHFGGPFEWLVILVIGCAGGLLGGSFARGVLLTSAVVRRASDRRPYVVAALLGLALAFLGIISDGATYGGGYLQARAILIEGRDLRTPYALLKAAASFVSLVSGIPGGLFDPSLSVGAGLGQVAWPLFASMDRASFILLVMGAYFAGVVQSPITAAVILVEMTAAPHLFLPLLAATITAYAVSRLVCPTALYEGLAQAFLRREESARG